MATLVFDSAPLSCFARARKLALLEPLTEGYTGDRAAFQVGRERCVRVQRTLALVVRGVRNALLSEDEAHHLIDDLLRAGARFPFSAGKFMAWARAEGLLGWSDE